jgi:hypothetical protein
MQVRQKRYELIMIEKLANQTQDSVESQKNRADDAAVRGRRAVLKGAVAAMPMILTLQSGAALARSSNMISASSPDSAIDSEGRTLCLDYRFVDSAYGDGEAVDVDPDGYVSVSAIMPRRYFREANEGRGEMSPDELCKRGGIGHYRNRTGPWRQTNYVPKGMLVSAIALSSVAHADITEF